MILFLQPEIFASIWLCFSFHKLVQRPGGQWNNFFLTAPDLLLEQTSKTLLQTYNNYLFSTSFPGNVADSFIA